jgi:hypothetical protein
MIAMSQEAELVRQIEELIAKIVAGNATEEDKRQYRDLSKRRVDLMQPHFGGPAEKRARVA